MSPMSSVQNLFMQAFAESMLSMYSLRALNAFTFVSVYFCSRYFINQINSFFVFFFYYKFSPRSFQLTIINNLMKALISK